VFKGLNVQKPAASGNSPVKLLPCKHRRGNRKIKKRSTFEHNCLLIELSNHSLSLFSASNSFWHGNCLYRTCEITFYRKEQKMLHKIIQWSCTVGKVILGHAGIGVEETEE
jgi:hypothetical protein